jgi:hypothetical protein
LHVDDPTDQKLFAEVFLPHLVDAFRLARWLAGIAPMPRTSSRKPRCGSLKPFALSPGEMRACVLTIVRNTSYSWLAKNRPRVLVLTEDLDQPARERMDRDDVPTPEAALIAKM